jgi:hypothetical protein
MKFIIEGEEVECNLYNGDPNRKGGMQVQHITCWVKYNGVFYPSQIRGAIATAEKLYYCTSITDLKEQILGKYP